MFDTTTHIKGDDLPGAIARLLCERPGEWFRFTPVEPGIRNVKEECIHTALIVDISEGFIRVITKDIYQIDRATFERLMEVLNRYEPTRQPAKETP
ncbi:hypothetical protein [Pantoea agglomerans]|uniref:hypothetical protein n=1 Tax=Enterobacter agglomerans TaxID=549 RepID=UPI00320AF69C